MRQSRRGVPTIEAANVIFMTVSVCLALAERSTPRFGRLRTAWLYPTPLHTIKASRCLLGKEACVTFDKRRRYHGYQDTSFELKSSKRVVRGGSKGFRRAHECCGLGPWSSNAQLSTTARSGRGSATESEPGEHRLPFGTAYHVPVVCKEVLRWLITDPEGVYVDCTLGGGGHSAALLDALGRRAKVVGLDRDPAALREASARLTTEAAAGRFEAIHANFADVSHVVDGCELLARNGTSYPARSGDGHHAASGGLSPGSAAAEDGTGTKKLKRGPAGPEWDYPDDPPRWVDVRLASTRDGFVTLPRGFESAVAAGQGYVDGILVDLGVSSRQIDDAARGFSFSADGPLDMRMDSSSGVYSAGDSEYELNQDSIDALSGTGSAGRERVKDTPGEDTDKEGGGEAKDDAPKSVANSPRGREALRSSRPPYATGERDARTARKAEGARRRRSAVAPSAADLVNYADERDIRDVIWRFGDEKRSVKIARAIVVNRPILTTGHLAKVVGSCVPPNERIKTLARVFQALRIKVNGELDALETLLEQAKALVKPGGRLVVLSYHSLEDRRVKRVLATGNLKGTVVKDFYGNQISPWRPLLRKPVTATAEEIALNPRARSVRLRVAERTELS